MNTTNMTFEQFLQSTITDFQCPSNLSKPLQGLWYEKKGNWHKAHKIVQDESDDNSAWVHAYLHRREGDNNNVHYWYRRSKKLPFQGLLEQEWEEMVRTLLD